MGNISDLIEDFINQMLGEESKLSISRNELAEYFDCVPSQINYVLNTRFTTDKGFVIESRRGGGGCITLVRMAPSGFDILASLNEENLENGLSHQRLCRIADYLAQTKYLEIREAEIIKAATSDKALASPLPDKDKLRANILKNVLLTLSKYE